MKIHIKNWHMFYFVVALIAFICLGIVFAVYDPTMGSHETLWSDRIEPKTSDKIIISGNVEVTGDLTIDGEMTGSGAISGGSVPVFIMSKGCAGSGLLTLESTCRTIACQETNGDPYYYDCQGQCNGGNPAGGICVNQLVGNFVKE